MTRSSRRSPHSPAGSDERLLTDGGESAEEVPEIAAHYADDDGCLERLGNGAALSAMDTAHVDSPTAVTGADVDSIVESYRQDGVGATAFVASNRPAATGLVPAAFEELRVRLDEGTYGDITR